MHRTRSVQASLILQTGNVGWIQQEASDLNAWERQSGHSVTLPRAADGKSAHLVVVLFRFGDASVL